MIDSIAIKAFKSLVDVEIQLGRVNVFVGANGSGKSNLLEAIGVLGAAASGRVDDESLLRRGVRPGVPRLYKSSFANRRARPSIGLEAKSGSVRYSVELQNPLSDPQPAWSFRSESFSDGSSKIVSRGPASRERLNPQRGLAALETVTLDPESPAAQLLYDLDNYAIYAPNTNTLRSLEPDLQVREPVGLSGGRLPEAVGELIQHGKHAFIRDALDSIFEMVQWAKRFGVFPAGTEEIPLSPSASRSRRVLKFVDKFMAEGRNELTGYDASEGSLYVLFTAALAVLPSAPMVLAIDNADHALNPRLARALMKNLCRWILEGPFGRQMLLTTHNPLVLDGLPLDNDDVRLFAVGRSRKGLTTVRRIEVNPKDLLVEREKALSDHQRDPELWTVSRLWVNGHLGGVPDV